MLLCYHSVVFVKMPVRTHLYDFSCSGLCHFCDKHTAILKSEKQKNLKEEKKKENQSWKRLRLISSLWQICLRRIESLLRKSQVGIKEISDTA